MDKTIITRKPDTNQLVFERMFDAPIERVFNAFTTAEALAKWWGPHGWETETKELNFEPGGRWHYGMKCVDENQGEWFGQTSWGVMAYKTIDAPNGFNSTDYFSNETGSIDKSMPATQTAIDLETVDGKTRFTETTTCETREAYEQLVNMGMAEGMSETLDRLDEYVRVG